VSYEWTNGTTQPLERILISGGTNSIRSRLWVNPYQGIYGLEYNVLLASRMQKAGLKIYIDMHFSDTWADPGHQFPPATWPTNIDALLTTIYNYTKTVASTFVSNGVQIEMISIGNEIANGLLWPIGKVPNYNNIAMLLKQASLGIKAGAPSNTPKIMIHLPNGWSWSQQETFYDNVFQTNSFSLGDFDIQGVSFYPFYDPQATFANLNLSLTSMANKYKKEIIVSETDWPDACPNGPVLSEPSIPVNAAGQLEWVHDVIDIVQQVPMGLATGIFYWEPAWLGNANLGSKCSDAILFNTTSRTKGTARSSVNLYN